jgi:hypothetical protein
VAIEKSGRRPDVPTQAGAAWHQFGTNSRKVDESGAPSRRECWLPGQVSNLRHPD